MTALPDGVRPPDVDQVRLMAVTSRLYHVHGLRQRDIGQRLGISQARVSRLLQLADTHGIARTVVAVPEGLHVELEEAVEAAYRVQEVHVVQADPAVDLHVLLGRAAAGYLGESGLTAPVVGFTSWSTTLQEMAHSLSFGGRSATQVVVEMLGDLGSPSRQHLATRSTQAMARSLGAEAVFLRTPGVAASPGLREAALKNPHVTRALALLEHLDLAFIGVGPPDVHSGLEAGDRYFTTEQLSAARQSGAVAQVNQRFIDAAGVAVETPLDDLVVGSTLKQVARAGRRVVVAGGPEKYVPLAAALKGGWADVLVTDEATARQLAPAGPV